MTADESTRSDLGMGERRGCAQSVLAAFFVALALIAAVVVPGVVACSRLDFDFRNHRHHLRPIAISPDACDAVEAIHDELTAFQRGYVAADFGLSRSQFERFRKGRLRFDQHNHVVGGRQSRAATRLELDVAAQHLDAVLALTTPAFPLRVQRRLIDVRTAIADGRRGLAEQPVGGVLDTRTVAKAFADGQRAAGFAGDLVGHQCGFGLQADSAL